MTPLPSVTGGLRFCLILVALVAAAGCMKPRGGAQPADNSGPIQDIPWNAMTPLPALTFDEGPSPTGFWARFVEQGPRLEVGRAGQRQPTVTLQMNSTADSFLRDGVTESYRLSHTGPLGEGYSVFNGLTPGNRQREPYALVAFTNADGTNALYGLLGEADPAPAAGVQHFNGGAVLSRRQGDNEVPVFTAQAQARVDAENGPQRLALLLTVPPELPRLFGQRVGAVQIVAGYDPATQSFSADRREVSAVGTGGRLRVPTFSLFGQVMNGGRSLAGLFRLYGSDGEPLVVGAFTLQTTTRPEPQVSRR